MQRRGLPKNKKNKAKSGSNKTKSSTKRGKSTTTEAESSSSHGCRWSPRRAPGLLLGGAKLGRIRVGEKEAGIRVGREELESRSAPPDAAAREAWGRGVVPWLVPHAEIGREVQSIERLERERCTVGGEREKKNRKRKERK